MERLFCLKEIDAHFYDLLYARLNEIEPSREGVSFKELERALVEMQFKDVQDSIIIFKEKLRMID